MNTLILTICPSFYYVSVFEHNLGLFRRKFTIGLPILLYVCSKNEMLLQALAPSTLRSFLLLSILRYRPNKKHIIK